MLTIDILYYANISVVPPPRLKKDLYSIETYADFRSAKNNLQACDNTEGNITFLIMVFFCSADF